MGRRDATDVGSAQRHPFLCTILQLDLGSELASHLDRTGYGLSVPRSASIASITVAEAIASP